MEKVWAENSLYVQDAQPLRWSRVNFSMTSPFDWLFIILGGLPLYLPFIFWLGESGLGKKEPVSWFFLSGLLITSPHVYSTYSRLSRKIVEKKVSWLAGAPCLLLFIGALSFAAHMHFLLETLTLVSVWQSIHYVRQAYGVGRYYSFGTGKDALSRQLSSSAFHMAMPLFVLGRWHTFYRVYGSKPYNNIIPVQFPFIVLTLCGILAGIGLLAGLYAEYRAYTHSKGDFNPARAVSLLVFFAIHSFGFLSVEYFMRGVIAVTMFHGVQYLGLVWKLERDHAKGWFRQALELVPRPASFPVFWAAFIGGGYLLEQKLLPHGNLLWPLWGTIVISAITAHHYAADTVMWRRDTGL